MIANFFLLELLCCGGLKRTFGGGCLKRLEGVCCLKRLGGGVPEEDLRKEVTKVNVDWLDQ
jgi:hypothetical protein